uniref:IQ motif containing with AAA domain 1 n=1 Tax=Phasianus colchicus TaxID=9054 RepID=A0A669QCE7_PHACC
PIPTKSAEIWTNAQKDLDTHLQTEREQFLQPEKDRVKAFRMLSASYIKYLQIFHHLEEAHSHLIHQQKRAAIRQVLDGAIGRILELKKEMVELENTEFHYIDNIIEDLKLLPQLLIPEDTEIPIPKYFIKENLEGLQQREKTLDEILASLQLPRSDMLFSLKAIKMIQVAERARQGRRRALFMKQIYLEEKRKRHTKLREQTGPNPDDAATCIQKVWRGYIQRKKTEKMREEEMIFLGMVRLFLYIQEDALQGEAQGRQEEEFIKDQLRETEGLDIRETLQDQIGQCFIECRHIIGRFPDYPAKEAGGSMAIFSQKTPEQVLDEGRDFLQDHDSELIKDSNNVHLMPLAHRTIDSLYRELAEEGVLIKAKPVNLSDYVGEYSYLGTTLHQVDVEPTPSLASIRQLIALYGILPLGSQTVHEKAPLVKALLLAGPIGVGKKMLVHAICTETGANLFNLSPSNIARKYPGKNGLQMMLHMVLKVAKQLQPSVVWIGDAEKTFYKAVPKAEEQMNPKRLEKILPKFLKALKAEDRVLLVGTTSRPFDAKIKPFCKVYQKIILIPRPDYASRFVLWKHAITQHGGEITKLLSISCLAKLSDGFTQGCIVRAVKAVLSELRLLQMARKPLCTAEFLTPLASQDPVYIEEEETLKVMLGAVLTGCLFSSPVAWAYLTWGSAHSAGALAWVDK